MNFLIFLGTRFESKTSGIEKYLPLNLSKYGKVICLEYPHFSSLTNFLLNKKYLTLKLSKSLLVYHSFGIFPRGRKYKWINILNQKINFIIVRNIIRKFFNPKESTIVITFTPELALLSDPLLNKSKKIYYVIDNYLSLPQWSGNYEKRQFQELEQNLLKKVNYIFTTSNTLVSKYKEIHKNVRLFIIPSNIKLYLQKTAKIPTDIVNIPHPIAGFIGSYYDWKIDTEFLFRIIKHNSQISFVFLGTIKFRNKSLMAKLLNLPNVYYLGSKLPYILPNYVANFDIGFIPYRTNQYGYSAYPVKIMEYLAMGKPVVTTALPSTKDLGDKGLIYWSKDYEEFDKNISKALKEKSDPDLRRKRVEEALKNDWGVRIKQFIKLINE